MMASSRKVWTRGKVREALASAIHELEGILPTSDIAWTVARNGRHDWPSANRVFEYYPGMALAWQAAGADPKRISLSFAKWTEKENVYLLDNAGRDTLKAISKHLGRSYPATRARLNKWYHIRAKQNQGYLSAAALAKEFKCPYHRVRTALAEGKIRGRFDKVRNQWQIDLADLTSEALVILNQPKLSSYRTCQTDLGDYYQRYGLKRIIINGRMVSVEIESN